MRIIRAIADNPYRILGVLASSSKREIVSNVARIKANIRIGRQVDFQYDLTSLFTKIDRSIECISSAEAEISLANGQLKHSQFWFIALSELDKTALNNLAAGNISQAISIWEKKDNVSSIHNRILCHLIQENYSTSIELAQRLYSQYEREFTETILAESSNLVSIDLAHTFIDTLCADILPKEIINYVAEGEWRNYIIDKTVQPLILKIEHLISRAKETKKQGAKVRFEAGSSLMNESFQPLEEIRELLSSSDTRFCLLSDKLGLEILQCGIDYYNNSDDKDAAYKAYELQEYAGKIVKGTMAKERCQENLGILADIISKLPPMEVVDENEAIENALEAFLSSDSKIENSIKLIKNCACHIVSIKSELGSSNSYYLKISTTIVKHALSYVIEEVNAILSEENCPFFKIKAVLIEAWTTMLYLDKFDIENSYKIARYDKNRQALQKIITEAKGFESSMHSFRYRYGCGFCNDIDVSDLDLRSDSEVYSSCVTISDYRYYINKFPRGKHIFGAKKKLAELEFANCKTIVDFERFIEAYPKNHLKQKAIERLNVLRSQEQAIDSCITLTQIIELYQREKSNVINLEKCSMKAFELCSTEEEYRNLVNVMGVTCKGGKLSSEKITEFEQNRVDKLAISKAKRIAFACVIIPLCISLIVFLSGDFDALPTTTLISSVVLFLGWIISLSQSERKGIRIVSTTTLVSSIAFLSVGLCSISIVGELREEREFEEMYQDVINHPTLLGCEEFADRFKYNHKYSRSDKMNKVLTILFGILANNSKQYDYYSERSIADREVFEKRTPLDEIISFSKTYSEYDAGKNAISEIQIICDSLYKIANTRGSIKIWEAYKNIVPPSCQKDSEAKIQEIENRSWNTDSKAWKTASSQNTINAYQKYKRLYPNGKYYSMAEKKIIDIEVASVYAGEHGSLPSMDRIGYGSGPKSTITVRNRTSYTLTLLYSGPDSKRLVLGSGQTSSITLKNGNYKVAASVSSSSVGKYAGSEYLTGGSYDVEYYISSYRY